MTADSEPAVLIFDVNETLIDIGSLEPHFERIFATLGQAVMRMTAQVHHANVTDDGVRDFAAGMQTRPAHPDAADGLAALREHGYRLVTLTNSLPTPDGRTPLQNADLSEHFERQFSVDPRRVYKPSPQLYTGVADEVGVPTSACMMVAAHPWDLIGAQAAGMSGALITRPGNAALPLPGIPAPTLVATDMRELARQLSGTRS